MTRKCLRKWKKTNEKFNLLKDKFAELQKRISRLEKNNRRNKLNHLKSRQSVAAKVGDSFENTVHVTKERIKQQSKEITSLQIQLDTLNEKVDDAVEENPLLVKGKQYSSTARLLVYDALVNQVPTANVPTIMKRFSMRLGHPIKEIPHRTTVEQMAREMGVLAQLQTAEEIISNKNVTIAFVATTQEGVHINAVLITTEKSALVVAIDQLPGGTAEDYANHITDSVDDLASIYTEYHPEENYQESRNKLLDNIANTMTDRVAANHAAIRIINDKWDKTLNEMNCHLHPLDSVSTCCRVALRKLETAPGTLYGSDCIAGNLVLQINKLRKA